MTTLKAIAIVLALSISSSVFASVPKGFSQVRVMDIKEDDVTFNYMSNDGTIDLKCAHVYDKPDAWDWDVWCGKGTNMLRMFRVHFLLRQYVSKTANKTAYEVLYWVTDRDADTTKMFSSATNWLQFNGMTTPDMLSFSQSVENDYASLTLQFHPSSSK
ncbi:MAG TPA: hypothetical protein VF412_01075 [Bdellovibrio sp.]|uniref:hypothetical protein n=1 Tax=Bdellovibrio sp. TaxID=28201 RepID=UPI002EF0ECB4